MTVWECISVLTNLGCVLDIGKVGYWIQWGI